MGNIWSIAEPRGPKLKYLNDYEICDLAIKECKRIVNDVIKKVDTIKNFDQTADYKKYHLYPGQEIFYKNVVTKNGIHPAIYLWDGLVMEIGTGPRVCKEMTSQTQSFFGITTLKRFKYYGKNVRKSSVYKVDTGRDHFKSVIISRLRKAKKEMGPQPFKMFTSNCVHITHEIVHGYRTDKFPPGTKFIQITRS